MNKITLDYSSVTELEGGKRLSLIVKKPHIKKLYDSGKTIPSHNVRGPNVNENKEIEKEIKQNAIKYPEYFQYLSQGVTGTCTSFKINHANKTVDLFFGPNDGQMNGGHLLEQFINMAQDPEIPNEAGIMINLVVGLPANISNLMPITLNKTRAVTTTTFDLYNGKFNKIKQHLGAFGDKFSWITNKGEVSITEIFKNSGLINNLVTTSQSYRNMTQILPALVGFNDKMSRTLLDVSAINLYEQFQFMDYVQYEIYCGNNTFNYPIRNIGHPYKRQDVTNLVLCNAKTGEFLRGGGVKRNRKLYFINEIVPYEFPKHLWNPFLFALGYALVDNQGNWKLGSLDQTKDFFKSNVKDIVNSMDDILLAYTTSQGRRQPKKLTVYNDPKYFAETGYGEKPLCDLVQGYLDDYIKSLP